MRLSKGEIIRRRQKESLLRQQREIQERNKARENAQNGVQNITLNNNEQQPKTVQELFQRAQAPNETVITVANNSGEARLKAYEEKRKRFLMQQQQQGNRGFSQQRLFIPKPPPIGPMTSIQVMENKTNSPINHISENQLTNHQHNRIKEVQEYNSPRKQVRFAPTVETYSPNQIANNNPEYPIIKTQNAVDKTEEMKAKLAQQQNYRQQLLQQMEAKKMRLQQEKLFDQNNSMQYNETTKKSPRNHSKKLDKESYGQLLRQQMLEKQLQQKQVKEAEKLQDKLLLKESNLLSNLGNPSMNATKPTNNTLLTTPMKTNFNLSRHSYAVKTPSILKNKKGYHSPRDSRDHVYHGYTGIFGRNEAAQKLLNEQKRIQYQKELEQQIKEQKERKLLLKKQEEEYEKRLEKKILHQRQRELELLEQQRQKRQQQPQTHLQQTPQFDRKLKNNLSNSQKNFPTKPLPEGGIFGIDSELQKLKKQKQQEEYMRELKLQAEQVRRRKEMEKARQREKDKLLEEKLKREQQELALKYRKELEKEENPNQTLSQTNTTRETIQSQQKEESPFPVHNLQTQAAVSISQENETSSNDLFNSRPKTQASKLILEEMRKLNEQLQHNQIVLKQELEEVKLKQNSQNIDKKPDSRNNLSLQWEEFAKKIDNEMQSLKNLVSQIQNSKHSDNQKNLEMSLLLNQQKILLHQQQQSINLDNIRNINKNKNNIQTQSNIQPLTAIQHPQQVLLSINSNAHQITIPPKHQNVLKPKNLTQEKSESTLGVFETSGGLVPATPVLNNVRKSSRSGKKLFDDLQTEEINYFKNILHGNEQNDNNNIKEDKVVSRNSSRILSKPSTSHSQQTGTTKRPDTIETLATLDLSRMDTFEELLSEDTEANQATKNKSNSASDFSAQSIATVSNSRPGTSFTILGLDDSLLNEVYRPKSVDKWKSKHYKQNNHINNHNIKYYNDNVEYTNNYKSEHNAHTMLLSPSTQSLQGVTTHIPISSKVSRPHSKFEKSFNSKSDLLYGNEEQLNRESLITPLSNYSELNKISLENELSRPSSSSLVKNGRMSLNISDNTYQTQINTILNTNYNKNTNLTALAISKEDKDVRRLYKLNKKRLAYLNAANEMTNISLSNLKEDEQHPVLEEIRNLFENEKRPDTATTTMTNRTDTTNLIDPTLSFLDINDLN